MKTSSTLWALVALALIAPSLQARTLAEIRKDGRIVIATEGQFPPFNFMEGQTLTGFEVELAEALAQKMNLKVEWKRAPFDGLLDGLAQNRWDLVIASHGITEERARQVTFVDPHYCTGGVIVSRGGWIKNVVQLTGKTVSVQAGTSYLANVEKLPGVKEIKSFEKDPEAMEAMISGRVNAWVTDKFAAKTAVKSGRGGLKMGDYVFVERVASAVSKDNTTLATELNKALSAVESDGSYATLSRKYFQEDIRCILSRVR